jgi:LPXTG-site transpeptidase (sortase) family protein
MTDQINTTETSEDTVAEIPNTPPTPEKKQRDWKKFAGNGALATGAALLMLYGAQLGYNKYQDSQSASDAVNRFNEINARNAITVQATEDVIAQRNAFTAVPTATTLRRETAVATPLPTTASLATEAPIAPTAEIAQEPHLPTVAKISIASIGLESDVQPAYVEYKEQKDGTTAPEWEVPEDKVAQKFDSGNPGEGTRIALWAHNGRAVRYVFREMDKVKPGDTLVLTEKDGDKFPYVINNSFFVNPEDIEVIEPTSDERVTLITCWPAQDTKINGVIVQKWSKRLVTEGRRMTPEELKLFQETQK